MSLCLGFILLVNVSRFCPQGARVPLCLSVNVCVHVQSCRCACAHVSVSCESCASVECVIKVDVSHVRVHRIHATPVDPSQFTSSGAVERWSVGVADHMLSPNNERTVCAALKATTHAQ